MESIAQLGYLLSALISGLILVLLSSVWRGRFSGILLWVAVLAQMAWSIVALLNHLSDLFVWQWGYALLDATRYLAWLLLLFNLLKPLQSRQGSLSFWLQNKVFWLSLPITLMLSKFFPFIGNFWFAITGTNLHYIVLLVLSLFSLVLTEQLFRYTRKEQRWALKFLCLGMALLFVYDFYLYSDAVLFSRIRTDIEAARGFLAVIYWPLIAVAVARNPRWSVDLFVSRTLAMRSAVVVLAGIYLTLMALAGYYLKTTESDWGEAFLLVLIFSAVVLLLLVLVSGSFRARVRLLVTKHFFASQYDYREEWLAFTRYLSEASQKEGNFLPESIRAMAGLVDSPGAMLWTRQSNGRFEFQAHWCMRPQATSVDINPVVPFLVQEGWVIEVMEFQENSAIYQGLEMPDWLLQQPLCWAVVPLFLGEELIGIVILATPRAKRRVNWEDRDLLKTAGQQLAGYVKLYVTTLDLVNARQFEAFNRLSAFVVHDLKNVCAQLSLITTNAVKHKNNPAFVDDAFQTVENAVQKMNRMLAHLRKDRVEAITTEVIFLAPVLHNVIQTRTIQKPTPLLADVDDQIKVRADIDKLSSVLNHLIQNAQEATPEQGRIEVSVEMDQNDVTLMIADNGCGMSDEFVRQRLFKPFDTTKGNAGMGIGVYQSREIIESFGGSLSVVSQPGQGTTFTIRLAGE